MKDAQILQVHVIFWAHSQKVGRKIRIGYQVRMGLKPIAVRLSANSLRCSFPGSAWERFPRWLCHLRTEQAAEPPRTRSQAEPGNEHHVLCSMRAL